MSTQYVAVHRGQFIARGELVSIIKATKDIDLELEPIVLEMESGKCSELNGRGDSQTVIDGLSLDDASVTTKRGRPKLGVKSKEITLLPRHWEWLASQRGSTSVTLRRLVDNAINNASVEERINVKQNQLYSLLTLFGDEIGFEEATRALYRNSKVELKAAIKTWSEDIQTLVFEKFEEISCLHNGEEDATSN